MVEVNALSWWHVIIFFVIMMAGMNLVKKSRSRVLASIMCFVMICVAGLRHGYIDTRAYRTGFEALNISEVLNWNFILNGEGKDRGFSVLSALIKSFSSDSQVFLFILSFITVGFLFWGIIKRVPECDLGIFLFITTGCYLDTMNGVRQALVAAILFYYFPLLLEKRKTICCMCLILLLSTIHATALVFIPIYFIATKKAWSKYTFGLVVVCVFCYVFFNTGIGAMLVDILEGTSYGEDYAGMLISGNTSVNILRVFIAAVPIGLSYVTRKWKKDDFRYNLFFNMTLLNFMVWLFSTKVLYFYRLSAYFTPYMIVFLCFELYEMKNSVKDHKIVKVLMAIFYLIIFIYQLNVMGSQFFVGYLKY